MKIIKLSSLIFILTFIFICESSAQTTSGLENINIKWQGVKAAGTIEVLNGELVKIEAQQGKAKIKSNQFRFNQTGPNSIGLVLRNININPGSSPTIVTVRNGSESFSFFLRDVTKDYPIYIPAYQAVVCRGDDNRSFAVIEQEIKNRDLQTRISKIESESEESFDSAALHTKDQVCPLWMGISRDIRIFELGFSGELNTVTPRMASSSINLPETKNTSVDYSYMTGRGQGVEMNTRRRLEDGVLPIIHMSLTDEDIEYNSVSFVALESTPQDKNITFGTHYLVADSYSFGHMFTPEQEMSLKPLLQAESEKTEETVLYFRTVAINKSSVPRYAYFRTVRPGSGWWEKFEYNYDGETGLSAYTPDRVFGVSKLNGRPLQNEEIAILLKPDETAVFEFFIPHNPVSKERALRLATQSFDQKFEQCRNFWQSKLAKAGQIKLPEKRIEEMIRAGLLHLDLITYGQDPDGTLAPNVGVYSPIGTESSPIMQFYNSMGLNDNARRSLMYFLDKQHDDGMIQNFGGYMVETGAALWSMGEYFRYTNDTSWVREVKPKLLKSCEFLLQWRERNKKENLKGKGYGMIDGKVADPEDQFHQFMLNGYAYIGLSRVAEMMGRIDTENSIRLNKEAEAWKQDIRSSLIESMTLSPVVPLGDGTWCPTAPPWTEMRGLRLFYLNPETFMSHGTFTVSDAMLGPLYLVFCEVLDPEEKAAKMLLDYHTELFYQRNAAFSQPYYSRHNWVQLKRGMVKPFLKTYYNTFSAHADRETYTFWEHLYQVSVHKTHEEAWFLMETRWMLYLEDNQLLKLLPGVPRKWFEDGKKIDLQNVASYFGPLSLLMNSQLSNGFIEATITCNSDRKPQEVSIRIPHPEGKKPVNVSGGVYDAESESVVIKPFAGKADIRVEY